MPEKLWNEIRKKDEQARKPALLAPKYLGVQARVDTGIPHHNYMRRESTTKRKLVLEEKDVVKFVENPNPSPEKKIIEIDAISTPIPRSPPLDLTNQSEFLKQEGENRKMERFIRYMNKRIREAKTIRSDLKKDVETKNKQLIGKIDSDRVNLLEAKVSEAKRQVKASEERLKILENKCVEATNSAVVKTDEITRANANLLALEDRYRQLSASELSLKETILVKNNLEDQVEKERQDLGQMIDREKELDEQLKKLDTEHLNILKKFEQAKNNLVGEMDVIDARIFSLQTKESIIGERIKEKEEAQQILAKQLDNLVSDEAEYLKLKETVDDIVGNSTLIKNADDNISDNEQIRNAVALMVSRGFYVDQESQNEYQQLMCLERDVEELVMANREYIEENDRLSKLLASRGLLQSEVDYKIAKAKELVEKANEEEENSPKDFIIFELSNFIFHYDPNFTDYLNGDYKILVLKDRILLESDRFAIVSANEKPLCFYCSSKSKNPEMSLFLLHNGNVLHHCSISVSIAMGQIVFGNLLTCEYSFKTLNSNG
eukprot:TRINITY_DN12191_c0_g1_i1.p1 TRINITY_DN12191_c0_g1~~TRINITY_DN12191_c0_g1_i1.p1  ORF type:complete len:556 (+),score=170.40 TRINITY_DN12191_c0_g1_i1:30-1670(+)